jgi:protein-disulfide isomerase
VIEKYPQEVKIVFKNFPLKSHKYAEKAATAAMAAARQNKFWEFHDRLFDDYKNLNDNMVRQIAQDLNLDLDKFDKDWKDPAIARKVKNDAREGNKAGVRGTPTVFINGRRLKKRSLDGFSVMIDEELQKTAQSSK